MDTERVKELFHGISGRVRRWQIIAPRLHDFLTYKIRRIIASRGASEGHRIRGYGSEPKYKAYKKALMRAGIITGIDLLRFRGASKERLYPSLTRKSHPEHVYRVSRRWTMDVGTKVPYASSIWDGGTNKFGERQPERPFLKIGRRTRGELADQIYAWAANGRLPRTR
jgi:phage gpG-like protein